MTPGIHLLHKPPGPTSFSVLQSLRAETHPATKLKMCHGGALDPFASGLLLILVEPATKLFDHLHAAPKTYETTIRWGIETDNGDPTGRPVFQAESAAPTTPDALDAALRPFLGWHDQIPPPTSNKRIAGERAYLKAHRGESFELPPTRVYLHEAHWLSHDLPRQSRLRLVTRGGYYVRALARDLGRSLHCGAHLAALHRASIGPWPDPGPGARSEVHGRDLLPWTMTRILTDQEVGALRQDRPIPIGHLHAPDWPLPAGFPAADLPIRGFHLDRFAFLLRPNSGQLSAIAALPGAV